MSLNLAIAPSRRRNGALFAAWTRPSLDRSYAIHHGGFMPRSGFVNDSDWEPYEFPHWTRHKYQAWLRRKLDDQRQQAREPQ